MFFIHPEVLELDSYGGSHRQDTMKLGEYPIPISGFLL